MPIVVVYGIPYNVSSLVLVSSLSSGIKKTVAGITKLNVLPEEVTVYFPQEMKTDGGFYGDQKGICVFVYLYDKPERIESVLLQMCQVVVEKIREFAFAKNLSVSCDPVLLNPRTSFSLP